MTRKRILVFSTYPIRKPRHGGQFRAVALLNAYKKLGIVRYVSVCNSDVYQHADCTKWDIRIPQKFQQEIHDSPQREPILIGQIAEKEPVVANQVKRTIRSFSPEIIVLEQPYLWPAVHSAIQELNISTPKIIYSSHNFEQEHYDAVTDEYDHKKKDLIWLSHTENDLVNISTLIVATTSGDIEKYSSAKASNKVALVPNAVMPITRPKNSFILRRIHKQIQFKKFALFVASAHTPNIEGFFHFIGTRLGYLPPGTGIVIAGTAGPVLGSLAAEKDPRWIDLYWSKVQIWGFASDKELQILTDSAALFILPILDGGGSNLKTALALQSDKYIVASEHAFRGFDAITDLEGVLLTNSKEIFQSAIYSHLNKVNILNLKRNAQMQKWDFGDFFETVNTFKLNRNSYL